MLLSDYESILKGTYMYSLIYSLIHSLIHSDFIKYNLNSNNVLGIDGKFEESGINYDELLTNVMSMDFFDRILSSSVAPNGNIRGCYEDIVNEIPINDLLKDLLINNNSENRNLYSDEDRKQFIFQLFKILVLGGNMNQPDTRTDRYLELTKGIYKDLLTIFKDRYSSPAN